MKKTYLIPTCALALLWQACASSPKKKAAGPDEVASHHKMVNPLAEGGDDDDGMRVAGTLGTLDRNAIQAGLSRPMLEITHCFDARLRQEPYLGGDVNLKFRVTRAGQIKKVWIGESSLGSMEAERCILDAARTASFERPRGGEAEFSYTVSFAGRVAPDQWNPGMIKQEIDDNRDKLFVKEEGRKTVALEVPNGLVVTMYLNRRGKVISVGMNAEEAIDEEFATHFVTVLKTIEFEKPQNQYAKVTFTW